ncbi:IclR family transcriptional regulator [Shouchella clausii]|uniref:IclR family transcriptional regulator n=1 Tax=Shouchella clausii TaxID=79880 RepID=UPI000B96BEBC|nr:IclR family transcriptional regulator [Shouchella clausii]AST96128.1 hypothetical protein BC8716_09290 [Shouchella clausii]MBU8596018.1 IclR family transcriptional regulator [Shouchella clausii]MCR1288911.1 IclR family transcriptional regulator [Shouchella clausii]MCY1103209.1 IclR family transcriptional regulator [Shouchella clausii]MEB5471373.1 IclR family transcriptional regulator [Shouchella clausii]
MEYQNKSLRKAFEIIESLCAKPMTATELSKKLNLNPSTLHRFLANLEAMGYTEKLKNNQVRLTQQFIQLGKMAQAHYDVEALSKPYLKKLADSTGESVLLSSFHQFKVTYLDKIESSQTVRIVLGPGSHAPSYAVASGKLFLSQLSPEQLDDFFANTELKAYTKNTFTDEQQLRKELVHIRAQNYAIDEEEYEIGLKGFAAPIREATGTMIAALSVAGVSLRFDDEKSKTTIEQLLRYAELISFDLGWKR